MNIWFSIISWFWWISSIPNVKKVTCIRAHGLKPVFSLVLFLLRQLSWEWYTHSKKYSTSYYETLCKWGDFERAKTTLKMLLGSWFLVCFFKRFRSFVAKNLEPVGQRATKLSAIKLWGWLDRDRVSNPGRLADWGRGRLADLSWDLQLWQLVILQPFDLQTPNF